MLLGIVILSSNRVRGPPRGTGGRDPNRSMPASSGIGVYNRVCVTIEHSAFLLFHEDSWDVQMNIGLFQNLKSVGHHGDQAL